MLLPLLYFFGVSLLGAWQFPDPQGPETGLIAAWASGREAGQVALFGLIAWWWARRATERARFLLSLFFLAWGSLQFVLLFFPRKAAEGLVNVWGMGNGSMAGCFAVSAIFFGLHGFERPPAPAGPGTLPRPWFLAFLCGALSTSLMAVRFGSSLPILAIAASTAVVTFRLAKPWTVIGVISGVAGLLTAILPRIDGNGASGRWHVYKAGLDAWIKTAGDLPSFLFGVGGGSMSVVLPLQAYLKQQGALNYHWLHSDWLQVLIEYGAVGFGLFTWILWKIFAKAYTNGHTALAASLASYAVALAFNFPLHHGWTYLLFACMVGAALSERRPMEIIL